MRRTVCVILLGSLLLALLAACSQDGSGNAVAGDGHAAETAVNGGLEEAAAVIDPYDPGLPEADFGEYEFRILNIDEETLWWSLSLTDVEELTGDAVNDAIYTRNRNMEQKYNFVVNEIRVPGGVLNNMLRNSVSAGTDDFDIVIPLSTDATVHAQAGLLVDLHSVPYLNFDRPWWNKNVAQNLSINNRLFFTVSDFILTDDESAALLMYNKSIAADLGLPTADELYQVVEDGRWTFDMFAQLSRDASADLTGSGRVDPLEDRFGVITVSWLYTALLGGFGETVISKDADDLPYISGNTERFLNAFIRMTEFMGQRDVVIREHIDYSGRTDTFFMEDRALFCGEVLAVVRIIRGMESDFSVMPLPKLDEYQENYYTYTLISTCIGIPVTNSDLERTGHILEALTAESRRILVPAYYEVALGAKYLRDEGSIRMLEIILENQLYDIGNGSVLYNWGGLTEAVRSLSSRGDTNLASVFERHGERTLADIQRTLDAFDAIG